MAAAENAAVPPEAREGRTNPAWPCRGSLTMGIAPPLAPPCQCSGSVEGDDRAAAEATKVQGTRLTAQHPSPPDRAAVTSTRKIRIAVVGAGRLGSLHAQKLAARCDVDLVAVVDPRSEARGPLAAACGAEALAEHALLRGKIDAAIIAAPTLCHHRIALDLIRSGIHVLVEKPLCPTAEEAEQLVHAAHRQGVVLQVGHVERFNPAFAIAERHTPRYIEATRAAPYAFRSMDVGVVLDLMIHDLDLVLALARSPIQRVDALAMPVLGPYEDVAQARLEFASGCVANLLASRVNFETVRRLHLWGPEGFAAVDLANRRATVVRYSAAVQAGQLDALTLAAQPPAFRETVLSEHLRRQEHESPAVDALALEQQDFLESIRLGRAPKVPGEAGRDAVAAAERILQQIALRGPAQPPSPLRVVPPPHAPFFVPAEPGVPT